MPRLTKPMKDEIARRFEGSQSTPSDVIKNSDERWVALTNEISATSERLTALQSERDLWDRIRNSLMTGAKE